MELNPKIKTALIKINFVERYEQLSRKFDAKKTPNDKRLIYIDGEEVMDIIQKLGYLPKFEAREKFYKIREEKVEEYTFGVHIILYGGMVDLVWVVRENDTLILGIPWGSYSRLLISLDYKIKKPVFGTYEDLDEIFKTGFEMYEDFKNALIKE